MSMCTYYFVFCCLLRVIKIINMPLSIYRAQLHTFITKLLRYKISTLCLSVSPLCLSTLVSLLFSIDSRPLSLHHFSLSPHCSKSEKPSNDNGNFNEFQYQKYYAELSAFNMNRMQLNENRKKISCIGAVRQVNVCYSKQ